MIKKEILKKYSFIVFNGNNNPIPYKRTTQRQKFSDKNYVKYLNYKTLIVKTFIEKYKKLPSQIFKLNSKYYVNIKAFYKNKKHGDTDNIAKGINDALFQKPLNDKFVAGSYDFFYDEKRPRVEIDIVELEYNK